jgi:amino acid transporter
MVYKDIQLSAKLMLGMEGISLLLIFILGAIVLFKNGSNIDTAQFTLKGVSFDGLRGGLVLAFFSFVGFESATALGDEAKNPLKNIPKAVTRSGIFVGAIFIIFSYIEVMGFVGSSEKLNEVPAALSFLAEKNGVNFMGVFISLGAMISFWSCVVACTTAAGRILLTMGRHEILHSSLAQTHEKNDTPHVAATVICIVTFIIPAVLIVFGSGLMDIFGWVGTIATLGFLFSYAMIVLGVPFFLHKIKELKPKNIIITVISFVVLMIPIVGSVYPLPAFPYSLFPFIFLGWLVIGCIWFAIVKSRKSDLSANVKSEIMLTHEQLANANN